jgi:hypothetical protein
MKTAMQELIEHLDGEMKSRCMLPNWDMYLEKEKEQIMTANIEGTEHGYRERSVFGLDARPYSKKRAEQYYNQTYNQNK